MKFSVHFRKFLLRDQPFFRINYTTTRYLKRSTATSAKVTDDSTMSASIVPILLVHGGAGTMNDVEKIERRRAGIRRAAIAGYRKLQSSGCVLDAVEQAVRVMEDDPDFNAGLGSILNEDGEVEMDASVMVGADLSAGAVTVVKDVQHPISLARLVMEKTEHILLAADGAKRFAVANQVPILEHDALVTDFQKSVWDKNRKRREDGHKVDPLQYGTVGAVAIDANGKMAAATSTGGREGKMVGRSSDTCMIGSGTYCDDHIGAVSTTGHGETIAKVCLAHSIIKAMEQGADAQTATAECIRKMTERLTHTAGAITISKNGDVGIAFSSQRMSWAYVKGEEVHYGIDQGQDEIVNLQD